MSIPRRFPPPWYRAERRDTPVKETALPARLRPLSRSLANIKHCALEEMTRIDLHQRRVGALALDHKCLSNNGTLLPAALVRRSPAEVLRRTRR